MSTSLITKKKRKPFGTRDGNALILRKTSSGVGGEKSKTSKSSTNLRKQGEKKKEEKKRPRNSKTPKTSNLTATAGAYNLSKEFAAVGKGGKQKPSKKVVRGGQQSTTHRSSTTTLSKGRDNTHSSSTTLTKGRDPSPIKRPDPSSKDGHLKMKQHKSNSLLPKSTKESSFKQERAAVFRVKTNNGKDGFVAASLKRLFPSSKEVAKKEPTRSKREPLDPSDDTVCTTPEQVSPLITSPLNKPDPPLNGKDDVHQAVKPVMKKNTNPQQSNRNSGILKEADNKRVLEAMLNSGPLNNNNNNREVDSVIGSFVGGSSLQRSYSIDGSEVTAALDDVENESQASMTTCGDRLSIPNNQQKTNNVADIFRTKVQPPSHEYDSKKSNIHQELRRANTIDSQTAKSVNNTDHPAQHQQQPLPNNSTAIQLPSGWKTRWSKTKQKPYYVHPDFGATWHCPGLKSTTNNNQNDGANAQMTASTQYQQSFRETKNTNHKEDVPFESATAANDNASQGVAANLNLTTSVTSSKCFTQDFESNDGALASTSSVFNEDQSDEMVLAVERAKQRLMQDEQRDDLVVENVEEEPQHHHNDDNPFEFDNEEGGFDVNEMEDDEDVTSQEQLNADPPEDEDPPTDDEDTPTDDDQHASVLDTNNNEDELNSLSSDHIDVDALLQNGRKEKTQSPMSTIKELRVESAQSRQSSQVSIDEEEEDKSTVDDDNDLAGLDLLQKDSDTLSPASSGDDNNDVDKSVAHHEKDDEDDNHSSPMLFGNHGNGGFEDEYDDVISSGGDVEEEIETLARQSKSRRKSGDDDDKVITGLNLDEEVKKESRRNGPKKKIFPPGPLCSLQFLEEIELNEFDTPLWRRMKRKRSTLESVSRGKAIKKEKRRRATYS